MKFTYPDDTEYFQPKMAGNHCFGCGAWNENGLRIMSTWDGEDSVSACSNPGATMRPCLPT